MKNLHLKYFGLIFISFLWLFGCISIPQNTSNTQAGSCRNKADQLAINQVQGAGHRSPYDGDDVYCINGIVTAIDGGGFYIQSENPDDDPSTSCTDRGHS